MMYSDPNHPKALYAM